LKIHKCHSLGKRLFTMIRLYVTNSSVRMIDGLVNRYTASFLLSTIFSAAIQKFSTCAVTLQQLWIWDLSRPWRESVRGGLFSKGRKTLSHSYNPTKGAFHVLWSILLRPLEKRPPRTKDNRTGRKVSHPWVPFSGRHTHWPETEIWNKKTYFHPALFA